MRRVNSSTATDRREPHTRCGTEWAVRDPVGRDPESLDGPARLRDELGIPEDATVLLAVGINQPRKGFGQLVRAFERIGGHRADPHLVIVGLTTSPHSNMLQQRVSADPSSRVHLVPVTRDVGDFLELADIFVNASDVESLPRSILEAIAAGVPVLATDVFGTGELIRDGVSGWLMTANDHTSITAGLLRALDSTSDDRRELAAAALSHCESFLDRPATVPSSQPGWNPSPGRRGLATMVAGRRPEDGEHRDNVQPRIEPRVEPGSTPDGEGALHSELRRVRRERDLAREELARTRAERDRLRVDLMLADLARAGDDLATGVDPRELDDLRTQVVETSALAAAATADLAAHRATLSWRVTLPLRAVRRRQLRR